MSEPVLYIIPNPIDSLKSAGKIGAHCAHAGHVFSRDVVLAGNYRNKPKALIDLTTQWFNSANGFGTTIVLQTKNWNDVLDLHSSLLIEDAENYTFFGKVVDPTYPMETTYEVAKLMENKGMTTAPSVYKKNSVIVFRKEVTAFYLFGDKPYLKFFLSDFKLHP